MPHPLYVPILIAGMLITGSSNSLWTKFQDMQCVERCDDPNPANHVPYEQPVWQSLNMFIGELGCFIPVLYTLALTRWRKSRAQQHNEASDDPLLPANANANANASITTTKRRGKSLRGTNILLMWLPALCDLSGTTLMNVGLLYTPVSIFQMTRGALVLFVGILSVMFLHRRLHLYQWLALIVVMGGIAVVGLSGSLVKKALYEHETDPTRLEDDGPPPETSVLIGVFFILFAQVFTATQFVIEEKIMSTYSVAPLVAVGWEGFFGALSILLLTPLPFLFPSIAERSPFFDLPRGWQQTISNPRVFGSSVAIAFSIGFFNFFGLSVTRHVSATARSVTDTCRTITIWIVSLGLGWEVLVWPYSMLQVAGFALLVYGTFLFNNLVTPPPCVRPPITLAEGEYQPLRTSEDANEALDETAALPADLGTSGYDVVPTSSHAANNAGKVRRD